MQETFGWVDGDGWILTVNIRRATRPAGRTEPDLSTVNILADITPDGTLPRGKSRMPIISATALKGGVGKTTLVHMLAGSFSLADRRLLLLDNDPQGSLSSGIFGASTVEQFDPASTIAAIHAGLDPLPGQVIRPTNIKGVDIIPGSMAAAEFNTPHPHLAPPGTQARLRDFLDEAGGDYDLILIDNPPNLAAATWSALIASDFCLVPVIPEEYGTASLSPVLESIRLVASGPNPRLSNLGIVLTMVQPRLGIHKVFMEALELHHGDGVFQSRIAMSPDIKEAVFAHKPVAHHKPRGASAKAFKALADEITARIEACEGRGAGSAPELVEVGADGQG